MSKTRTILLLSGAMLLTSCASVMNGERQAMSVAEAHPITVDQQTVSLMVPVDPSRRGLSRQTLAEIDGFMSAYRTRGHGPVTVSAPSGAGNDLEAHQTAAEVRTALNTYGLDYALMEGATYRAARGEGSAVILSFTRYVASGPECGDFGGEGAARRSNLRAPNFGCADRKNLAAMIADPRDLTAPQDVSPTEGGGLARGISRANAGTDDLPTN